MTFGLGTVIMMVALIVVLSAWVSIIRGYFPLKKFYLLGFLDISFIFIYVTSYILSLFIRLSVLNLINCVFVWIILYRILNLKFRIDYTFKRSTPPLHYYHQRDKRWRKIKYGTGTFGNRGCGAAVAAMIVSSLVDPNITPVEAGECAAKWGLVTTGTKVEFQPKYLEKFGIAYNYIQKIDTLRLRTALEQKCWVIASIKPLFYSKITHAVIIREIKGEDILIADPANFTASLKYIKLKKFLKKCVNYQFVAVWTNACEPQQTCNINLNPMQEELTNLSISLSGTNAGNAAAQAFDITQIVHAQATTL